MDLFDLPIVDDHGHPFLTDPWAVSHETFLQIFTEGRPGTMLRHLVHGGYYQRALHGLAKELHTEPDLAAVLDAHRRRRARLLLGRGGFVARGKCQQGRDSGRRDGPGAPGNAPFPCMHHAVQSPYPVMVGGTLRVLIAGHHRPGMAICRRGETGAAFAPARGHATGAR